ncbi:MAG: hypothetical protein L6416_10610 [Candidatus Omnitrophica bacterium]|nr:hypothetical protein [Candidatus Omnitrophota bacterium]
MKKTVNILIIFIFLAVVGLANECLFYKEIAAPKNIENEVGAVTFDSQMYLNTDNAFANLRIYDAKNNEIPYLVRKLRGKEIIIKEDPLKMKILSLEELPDNSLSIIVERDAKEQKKIKFVPSELTIKTSNDNFEKTVSIYGSDNKEQWHILCENQPIFDYSRFIDLRNTRVSFNKRFFKYYKIVIDNVAQALVSSFSQIFTKYTQGKVQEEYAAFTRYEGVLRINGLDFVSQEEKPVYGEKKMIPYPLAIREVKINEKDKTSEIYLVSKREPLTRILFNVKSKNFKRKVLVEAADDSGSEAKWIRLVSSELFNISAGNFYNEKLKIELPFTENRHVQYRVSIFNYDNAPIEVSSVKAEGSVHEIIFFHNNEKYLNVYYGGQDFKSPNYDVSSVLAEIPLVTGERWEIGQEKVNEKADLEQKPIISPKQLLIIALTIMAIVLVYLITVSVKKVDEITK